MSLKRRQASDPRPDHPYADICGWCVTARARFPVAAGQGIRIVAICPHCDMGSSGPSPITADPDTWPAGEQDARRINSEQAVRLVGPPIMMEYIRRGHR